jgi:hypothetical protein
MRRTLKVSAVALLISGLAIVTFAQAKDPSGRWTATLGRDGKSMTSTMELKLSGDQVSGTIDLAPGVKVQIQNGKLEGNQLTFDVAAPEHGHKKNIHFIGDLSDDSITLRNESGGKQGRTMIFQRARK